MPNRIIKESVCTSDTLDELSWFEEVVFYRLLVNCDDYGRMDGRAAIVKSRLFPLKSNVTERSITEALNKLSTVGLVTMYEYDGRPYLQLVTWERHQSIRAKKSKYPSPESGVKTSASNRVQVQANAPVIQSNPNPIQSESESNARTRENTPKEGFEQFWTVYPKQYGKPEAMREWTALSPDTALCSKIVATVERQCQSKDWQQENGKYIPNPAKYLRERRWEGVKLPTKRDQASFNAMDLDNDIRPLPLISRGDEHG
ncbi:hypothetical protein H8K20_06460 [Neobittarella massiliensis]|uniref:Uncharacterized protein n=1 Tax=Neobittarella massiliensis (ex Bilen et al. 2018) TaxID=2041842 RepID=A0A8J6IPS2_9FIRM|nr:hypothetical protein [Neobittarella massiliensis]MBC3516036.1 hypothetical protein [Neobittarella massiliensis]